MQFFKFVKLFDPRSHESLSHLHFTKKGKKKRGSRQIEITY